MGRSVGSRRLSINMMSEFEPLNDVTFKRDRSPWEDSDSDDALEDEDCRRTLATVLVPQNTKSGAQARKSATNEGFVQRNIRKARSDCQLQHDKHEFTIG